MIDPLTRRTFLAASAAAVATLALDSKAPAGPMTSTPGPFGPVYGRTGPRGILPGSDLGPSKGEVILLDGRVIEVSHVTSRRIGPGKSVFLAPGPNEGWSILYAEC